MPTMKNRDSGASLGTWLYDVTHKPKKTAKESSPAKEGAVAKAVKSRQQRMKEAMGD